MSNKPSLAGALQRRLAANAAPPDPDTWVAQGAKIAPPPAAPVVPAEPTKRLTLDIPASLHRRFKSWCAMQDDKTTMLDEVVRMLEERFPPDGGPAK